MAHFRGTVRGNRSVASRLGTKASGLTVEAQSWQGKCVVFLYNDRHTGQDMARVTLERHNGAGMLLEVFHGPVSGNA